MQAGDARQETPEAILARMRILWVALLVSQFVLVYVSHLRSGSYSEKVDFAAENIFYVVAAVVLILSHKLPKLFIKKLPAQKKADLNDKTALTLYFVPFVLSIALSEACSILGLNLVVVTHDFGKILPFAAAGILNHVYLFPRKDKILAAFNADKVY